MTPMATFYAGEALSRDSEMTMSPWSFRLALAVVVALTLGRVMTTHRVFSETSDEPYHLAGGYDVLKKHSFSTDIQHPPLARIFFALPFINTPEPARTDAVGRGNALLLRNDRYTQNLARARLGNLLFLALGIVAVARWAKHLISASAGLLAAALFAMLPPILAHAGLATTDMAVAATLPLALDALTRELDAPSWWRSIIAGLTFAAGALSKYSFFVYFPAAALALVIVQWARSRRGGLSPIRPIVFIHMALAVILAVAVVWAVFGFSFQPLAGGLAELRHHNATGHRAFLFGQMRWEGWWYYFPVALFFKTPIPFLILALAGCILLARRRPEIPLIAAAILAVAMTSHINIGIRHLLPIFAPLAIAAAAAILELRRLRIVSAALVLWLLIDGAVAHPDYLPWFNGFAREPNRILNDSNLDWGQDVLRLVRFARREHIPSISVTLFTSAELDRIGLPPVTVLKKPQEVHGWFAISEMQIAIGEVYSPEVRDWLQHMIKGKPYTRIGASIRVYYLE